MYYIHSKRNFADVMEDLQMKRFSWIILQAKECQQPWEAGKDKKVISPRASQKNIGSRPDFQPGGFLFQTSNLQNCKITNACSVKPLTFVGDFL